MQGIESGARVYPNPKAFCVGDFAGTGRAQVLAVSRYHPANTSRLSRIMLFDVDKGTTLHNADASLLKFQADNNESDIIFAIDFDGDGRRELCHIHANGTNVYQFSPGSSTPLGFYQIATITDLTRSAVSQRKLMVGDINGDGKTDLLLSPNGSYNQVLEETIAACSPDVCPHCGGKAPIRSPLTMCVHCFALVSPATNCYSCGTTLQSGVCPVHGEEIHVPYYHYVSYGNVWTYYYATGNSTGNGFVKKTQNLFNHERNIDNYILQDVNNDGKADLVRKMSGTIKVYPADNNGISPVPEPTPFMSTYSSASLIPTEVMKDGTNTNFVVLYDKYIDQFHFTRNDAREHMMSAAVNSMGVVTKTDYGRLNDKSQGSSGDTYYTIGTGASFPFNDIDAPLWATNDVQTWHKGTKYADYSYRYAGLVIHRQGLGFRGMTRFTARDNLSPKFTTQTFNPLKYNILVKEESPTARSEMTYSVITAANKTAIVQLQQQKVTDLLKQNIITSTYSLYDSYNNPGKIVTDYGSGVKNTKEYTYYNTESAQMFAVGIPKDETNTATRNNASWVTKTALTYTANWQLETKTDYVGASQTGQETFGYDTEGNLTNRTFKPYSSTKPALQTSYTYDTNKRLMKTETDAMGRITTYDVYDAFGRVTSVKNYLNKTTQYEYDKLDRQIKVTTPDNVVSENKFAWNSSNNGSVISITSTATKQPAQIQYLDAFGRTTREAVAGFNGTAILTDYRYDSYGRLDRKSEPYTGSARYITYGYDAYDRLSTVTMPSTRSITTTYSLNTVTVVDAGLTTKKTYDASGALLQSTDPAGTITYALRPDGQPSSITAPDNTVTSFEYDGYGRQTKIIDPSAGAVEYKYDSEGLLYQQINARSQIIKYEYDNWGRPLKTTTPEQIIDYVYRTTDKKLEKITAGTHFEVSYDYDALGRVNKETEKEGAITLVKDYTYEDGRVKTVKYNNVANDVLTYTYNTYGYLSDMKFGTTIVYTANSRDQRGQLTKYTYGNGVVTDRTYSVNGSPLTIKSYKTETNPITNLSFAFDDVKGLLNTRNDVVGSGEEAFQYDNLRRLKQHGSTTRGVQKADYNDMGNITFKTDAGGMEYNITAKPYAVGWKEIPAPQTMSVRYIRDAVNGNTVNAYCHWVEVQALTSDGANVALGKSVSGATMSNPGRITDGNTTSSFYADAGTGSKIITIDLGQVYAIAEVKVWHYYADWRTYKDTKTEVSADGVNWITLHDAATDGTYRETSLGRSYGPNTGIPERTRNATYTAMGRPATISEGGLQAQFSYNHAGERTVMKLVYSGSTTYERHYLGGNYERENRNNTITERLYLGGTPYDAPAVAIRTNGGAWTYNYIHRDYLGSIIAVSNASGTDVEKRSYDAWGRLRQPQTAKLYGYDAQPTLLLNRGYTSHEHLPEFGLINMNARLYDPVVGRFLSPDPYVQAPDFSQNFNRYSYCLNNPLIYTDPTGEFIFSLFLPVIGPFLDAACWGAVISGASYTASVAMSNGGFNNWNWGQFGKSVGFGALSGAVTFGIGEAFQAAGNFAGNFGTEAIRGAAHGLAQGGLSALQGGDFWSGFASGTLGSWASSGYSALGLDKKLGTAGMLGFGALSGGIGAAATGGDFWQGAGIGLMTSGLNHVQHKVEEHKFFWRLNRHYTKGTGEDFFISKSEFKYILNKGKIDYENAVLGSDNYYITTINLYGTTNDLEYSFGRATVKYRMSDGKHIYGGFYDKYDFDSKPWGVRSNSAEIITRSYNSTFKGTSFNIYYNKRLF